MRHLLAILVLVSPAFASRQLCEQSAPGQLCFHFVPQYATFVGAEQTCRQLGGQLATIQNAQENAVLAWRAYTLSHTVVKADVFWVGGVFSNWRWNWVNGQPVGYHNFATATDLQQPPWPCLAIIATNNYQFNGFWLPTFCNGVAPFVCEVRKSGQLPLTTPAPAPRTTTRRPTTTVPVPPPSKCDGQTSPCFQNHLYLVQRIPRSWDHAEEYCRQRGGHLVSILSHQEGDFVAMIAEEMHLGFNIWIGGFRTKSGRLIWNDGSKWEYSNFNAGQPNAVTHNNCIEIFDTSFRKWANYDCKMEYPSICKVHV